MNFKKIILSSLFVLGCLTASAQEAAKTEYVFNPYWYLQLQGGGQYTLGEIKFEDLLSPNAQVTLGYQFDKVVGARLAVNAWQSKAGSKFNAASIAGRNIPAAEYNWKWNYVAPTIDFTFNLSNAFCGYNPKRVFNFSIFAGAGANIAWKNDEALEIAPVVALRYPNDPEHQALENVWDDTAVRFVGQFGIAADFRLCDAVSLGLELQANTLNDHYNSKKADNADWYFNALAGVKINLGKTYTTKIIPPVEPKVIERVVERVVEKPVPAPAPAPTPAPAPDKKQIVDQFHRDIFFTINSSTISKTEATKVAEIADFMKKNPDMKVTLVGYADKGTGTPAINARLSAQRAAAVKKALISKYGIAESKIVDDSKGDIYQPFAENDKNRVTICVVE